MTAHPPPVPREPRNPQGGSQQPQDERLKEELRERNRETAEQGRQGNLRQNTTNKGLQQDR